MNSSLEQLKLDDKILVTGAAGLLGQNLIYELCSKGFNNIYAIDKNEHNLNILQKQHEQIHCKCADLSEDISDLQPYFEDVKCLFLLQAQITGDHWDIFEKNTIISTKNVVAMAERTNIPFTVFVGSSVVNSVADDNYTRSKKEQEKIVQDSNLNHCVARPTLMFGWFDPKHFGWLSRFMAKVPVFPIPGSGKYMRQPLYVIDFCRVLIWCAQNTPYNRIIDIVGQEDITYIDIIKAIKKAKKLHTLIVKIPVPVFRFLMKLYALVSKNPPFVADQLDALMAGDYFKGENMSNFGVTPTPFAKAIDMTFNDPVNSKIVLERS